MSHQGQPRTPHARDDVVFRALAREWVLYDPEQRKLHVLNATAALVWSLCDGDHDAAAIANEIAETLREPPSHDAVRQDVDQAILTFARAGLLA